MLNSIKISIKLELFFLYLGSALKKYILLHKGFSLPFRTTNLRITDLRLNTHGYQGLKIRRGLLLYYLQFKVERTQIQFGIFRVPSIVFQLLQRKYFNFVDRGHCENFAIFLFHHQTSMTDIKRKLIILVFQMFL